MSPKLKESLESYIQAVNSRADADERFSQAVKDSVAWKKRAREIADQVQKLLRLKPGEIRCFEVNGYVCRVSLLPPPTDEEECFVAIDCHVVEK